MIVKNVVQILNWSCVWGMTVEEYDRKKLIQLTEFFSKYPLPV